MATSTPSKASSDRATTSTCSPRTASLRPAERGEAIRRISPQMSACWDRIWSMTVPTAPVAPTTASVGPYRVWPSAAGASVDDGLVAVGVEPEGGVHGADGLGDVVLAR